MEGVLVSVEILLDRLEAVRDNGRGRWMARCPAHDDRSPSLSIRETDDRILVHCHAGCGAADVVAAVGLELRDLFTQPLDHHIGGEKRERPRVDWRAAVFAIRHDLIVLTLAASKLRRHDPLTNDEDAALERALESVERAVETAGGSNG